MKERPLLPVRRVEESYKLEELCKIRAGKDSHEKAAQSLDRLQMPLQENWEGAVRSV